MRVRLRRGEGGAWWRGGGRARHGGVCVTFVSLCVCVQPTPDGGACVSPGVKLRECLCTRGHVPVYSPLSLYTLPVPMKCGAQRETNRRRRDM